MVDVTVQRLIRAAPAEVARVMFDASRDPEWIGGARKAEKLDAAPYGLGTRVRRQGSFLGRSFAWVTEIVEFTPERLVRMKHISGPFKGGVDYAIAPAAGGAEVSVRNYGRSAFWFPFMSAMMRMAVGGDLKRLQKIVERRPE